MGSEHIVGDDLRVLAATLLNQPCGHAAIPCVHVYKVSPSEVRAHAELQLWFDTEEQGVLILLSM